MLKHITLLWGVLALVGMGAGFLPFVGAWRWLNLPFAIAGAITGIIVIFRQPQGARNAVIGTAMCMVASIAGLVSLVMSGDKL